MRVLLVDPYPIVREGLKNALALNSRAKAVGEAGTLAEALELLANISCSVIMTDLTLPDAQGTTIVATFKAAAPGVPLVVFSREHDAAQILQAVQAGVDGYLVKHATLEEIAAALTAVHAGKQYLHPTLVGLLMKTVHLARSEEVETSLTPRQEQVLALVLKGHKNSDIGQFLHVSLSTVKAILRLLFARFEVTDRTQLILCVTRQEALHRRLQELGDTLASE